MNRHVGTVGPEFALPDEPFINGSGAVCTFLAAETYQTNGSAKKDALRIEEQRLPNSNRTRRDFLVQQDVRIIYLAMEISYRSSRHLHVMNICRSIILNVDYIIVRRAQYFRPF